MMDGSLVAWVGFDVVWMNIHVLLYTGLLGVLIRGC
jgi:hypothetical protein